MIETPTVLILGAGASAPYGYPLGDSLKNKIISLVGRKANEDSDWFQNLIYPIDIFTDFATKLRSSRQPSIDSFLANQTNDFSEIGKLAISEIIIKSEHQKILENPRLMGTDRYLSTDPKDDWYSYLIEHLFKGDLGNVHKNIGIISYNYDRFLEATLMQSLLASYADLEIEEASKILNKIPIVHMYGRLDALPWEDGGNKRQYGQTCSFEEIQSISRNIKLIHETEKDGTSIKRANHILAKSRRAYFLGMDLYRNRSNIELLDLSLLRYSEVLATGFKLAQGEIYPIEEFFAEIQQEDSLIKSPSLNTKFQISNNKTLECIKQYKPF